MAKSSYFYVLFCNDGTLYGGYTTDLDRRTEEHNSGTGAKYTRPARRRPVKMLYAEEYATRSEATKAEAAFKRLTRKNKDRFLKERGVSLPFRKNAERIVQCMIEEEIVDEEPAKLQ